MNDTRNDRLTMIQNSITWIHNQESSIVQAIAKDGHSTKEQQDSLGYLRKKQVWENLELQKLFGNI